MSAGAYPFREIEARWQRRWAEAEVFYAEPEPGAPKWFVIELPPFSNGTLHLGHVRNYSLADASARFRRQAGHRVRYTSGFDAFGLPAELAAAEEGCHPRELSERYAALICEQFVRLGLSHDVRRITSDCEPRFYRWVQWVCLRLLEAGLLYRADRRVNWCPGCETSVEDQLIVSGACWRCGSVVGLQTVPLWFIRELSFADDLLDSLEGLTGWSDGVKDAQRLFLGRTEGVAVRFEVAGHSDVEVSAFVDQPELLGGATYLAVSADHPVVAELRRRGALAADVDAALAELPIRRPPAGSREDRRELYQEQRAVSLGVDVLHPVTGASVPLLGSDAWELRDGRAAVGIAAHQRVAARVAASLDLAVAPALLAPPGESDPFAWDDAWLVAAGSAAGRPVGAVRHDLRKELLATGRAAEETRFATGDWNFSRQRYWGAPLPVIHCDACGAVPVPEEELPVLLPEDVDLGAPGNPLRLHPDFAATACPHCGGRARRDTDTLGAYTSQWWYMWIAMSLEGKHPFLDQDVPYWLPVDLIVGGIDQATTFFLHSRTMSRSLHGMGLVPDVEPAAGVLAIGMVQRDGRKMSKSAGNAVDPDELIERYGADALRLSILGGAAPERDMNWSVKSVGSRHAWLGKVWEFASERAAEMQGAPLAASDSPLRRRLDRWLTTAASKATAGLARHACHLAVKDAVGLFDRIAQFDDTARRDGELDEDDRAALAIAVRVLAQLLGPLAPHLAEELQALAGGTTLVAAGGWPAPVPG